MKRLLPAWLWLVPFALVFVAFQLAPLGWIAISAFHVEGAWGLGHFREIAGSTFFRQAIGRSLEISLISSLLGLIIATLACHSLTRTSGPLRRWMIAFTNMTSNFAGVPLAFAFIILMGANGVLTIALQRVGLIDSFSLYSRNGLIVIYTWFQIPLGILLLFPAFEGLRAEWRDAARLLAPYRSADPPAGTGGDADDSDRQRHGRLCHRLCAGQYQLQPHDYPYRQSGLGGSLPAAQSGQCPGAGSGRVTGIGHPDSAVDSAQEPLCR